MNKVLLILFCAAPLSGCASFFAAPPESAMQRVQAQPGAESDWLASRAAHYERAGLPKSRAREQAERDLRSPAGMNASPARVAPR